MSLWRSAAEYLIHEPRERAWRKVVAAEAQAEAMKRIADRVGVATEPTLHGKDDYQYIEDAPRDGTLLRLHFEGDGEELGFWRGDGTSEGGCWVDRQGQRFGGEPDFFALAPAYSAAEIARSVVKTWVEVMDPPVELDDRQLAALQWLIVTALTRNEQGKADGISNRTAP